MTIQAFEPDPGHPGRQIWRLGGGRALASLACGLLLGLMTASMLLAGLVLAFRSGGTIDALRPLLIVAPLVLFTGLLTHYVLRDAWGKRGMWIAIDARSLVLHLPAGRSLIHRPPACRARIDFAAIEAIETRLEGYPAQGGAMLQRPYLLKCRDRDPILLFEDRGLASMAESGGYAPVAIAICEASGAQWRELPMAQGRGGLLGCWFTRPPEWSVPPMSASAQQRLWRRVMLTGLAASGVSLLVIIASLL